VVEKQILAALVKGQVDHVKVVAFRPGLADQNIVTMQIAMDLAQQSPQLELFKAFG